MSSGPSSRPFCSDISRENDEPLGGTASRIDHWLLVEYRGLWSHDALAGSGFSDQVKMRLRELAAARPRTRLLFIRRPGRRHHEGLAVYVADSREGEERLAGLEIGEHEELRRLDPFERAEPIDQPLFLVCTHGKHDRCCARYGRPLWEGVSEQLDESSAWQCTHVGGDRFAGNLVALPHGLYYGRVDRDDVADVLDHHFAGQLALGHYRGRSCWSFAVQAAERRVRAEEGLTGLSDLSLDGVTREAENRWTVRFQTRVGPREVDVVEELGELTLLTCSSRVARRPRRYVAMPR
ncbi:MAG TPA: sucrase ferredoxin [Gaiellaceae bacterium]